MYVCVSSKIAKIANFRKAILGYFPINVEGAIGELLLEAWLISILSNQMKKISVIHD